MSYATVCILPCRDAFSACCYMLDHFVSCHMRMCLAAGVPAGTTTLKRRSRTSSQPRQRCGSSQRRHHTAQTQTLRGTRTAHPASTTTGTMCALFCACNVQNLMRLCHMDIAQGFFCALTWPRCADLKKKVTHSPQVAQLWSLCDEMPSSMAMCTGVPNGRHHPCGQPGSARGGLQPRVLLAAAW